MSLSTQRMDKLMHLKHTVNHSMGESFNAIVKNHLLGPPLCAMVKQRQHECLKGEYVKLYQIFLQFIS